MSHFKRSQRKYVKKTYRVRNWHEYEAGLRERGSLTVWISLHDGKLANWDKRSQFETTFYRYKIIFVPGGFFANMYNSREQVSRDLHDGLQMVSDMVGGAYRPKSVNAGFLAAENLRFLSEEEGIHICQGNIWSQYAVDNGDGDGSICYPYYPSREHFCKPAQGRENFIDCVNLDGWTVDFLCARYPGSRIVNQVRIRSRQGVGPIETLLRFGDKVGAEAMLATTANLTNSMCSLAGEVLFWKEASHGCLLSENTDVMLSISVGEDAHRPQQT